ncbi:ADP-glyceromanno-heptose 6-epimerase [Methylacidimicrobium tartarophylax]|uniref:ADP-L-glycero-D-manno-heptose-6-epimerase n=1 Tax=Methylacidimicrobium tartarophylax TaxID=1041768 RepID=A0A5E6MEA0_9BACT|nr:ADP-glyceromanno-heptose 6-epimerase [Methylacidimicrobium tartarophylax]VVM06581.1 ADP-L-glycero-D-manno-heptose 6-epimerase [Methylacidimicrobium tartarophylax]
MRIIVTGAAGFIGSNLVRALNARGYGNILAVDNLAATEKFHNLVGLQIEDYLDKNRFYEEFAAGRYGSAEAVFHQGACSSTVERDGRYMMENNYRASRTLLEGCRRQGARLIYASSAAVYGTNPDCVEQPRAEHPLNVYGYSKLLFDQVVRRELTQSSRQIVGLRYFNVYGPGEAHKGRMASVAFHQFGQYLREGKVRLFGAYGGYDPGEQERDFLWIDDLVSVSLWFWDHPEKSGIFNLGTGRAQSFNALALSVVNALRQQQGKKEVSQKELVARGEIEYVDFPEELKGKYQTRTQADLTRLRGAGCEHQFLPVEEGVPAYVLRLWESRSHERKGAPPIPFASVSKQDPLGGGK